MPLIDKLLDWLWQTKCYALLDFISGYHQIRIKEDNKWKIVFKIQYGHFKYQVISFILTNALAIIQGYINNILAKKLDIFIIIYSDLIFIYTKDLSHAYIDTVWLALKELRKYGLFANLKNCQFHEKVVCFLEYVISAQKVQIKDEKNEVIRNWFKQKLIKNI